MRFLPSITSFNFMYSFIPWKRKIFCFILCNCIRILLKVLISPLKSKRLISLFYKLYDSFNKYYSIYSVNLNHLSTSRHQAVNLYWWVSLNLGSETLKPWRISLLRGWNAFPWGGAVDCRKYPKNILLRFSQRSSYR